MGNEYEVIGIGRHSETLESFVIYRALYGDQAIWIRPEKMFTEIVTIGNNSQPRFEKK